MRSEFRRGRLPRGLVQPAALVVALATVAAVAALLAPADAAALPADIKPATEAPAPYSLSGSSSSSAATSTLLQSATSDNSFTAVSVGGIASCGLRTDGTITCWDNWGRDYIGQAGVPSNVPSGTFTAVSAGWSHSCGLRTDGTITCWNYWGWDDYGQEDAPSGSFTAVSAGWSHSCGLRTDGTITCWGSDPSGQTDAPGGTFTAVSAGSTHSCGLRTDGTIACWGSNPYGEANNWQHAPEGSFTAVSPGSGGYSCGVRTDGTIACWNLWGDDYYGYGQDAPSGSFTTVSAGWHPCGLRTDGTIACWDLWGRDDNRQHVPAGSFTTVSVGHEYSCGVRTEGTITCWSHNNYGQAEAPSGSFTAVSAGGDHSCGLRTDGTITCWGRDPSGQTDAPGGTFTAVSAGSTHSCGLRTDGTITCWGLGSADAPSGSFTAVDAGGPCGVRTDGVVVCWARYQDEWGVLSGSFTAVSASRGQISYACGLRTDGTVTCWSSGYDAEGLFLVEQMPGLPVGSFSAVSAGWVGNVCGLRTDGTIACGHAWGSPYSGQAGVPSGKFTAVSAGSQYSCGLRTDGTIACWGDNNLYGQADAPAGSFIAVSAGRDHSCGVRTDGVVVCWGLVVERTAGPVGAEPASVLGPVSNVRFSSDRAVWNEVISATSYDVELRYGSQKTEVLDGVPCCELQHYNEIFIFGGPFSPDVRAFRVRAVNSAGVGPWSQWVQVGAAPGAVSNVSYASGAASWSAAEDATSYIVRLWDGTSGRNVEGVACCRYSIPSGITRFNVRGVNSVGPGPWSGWVRTVELPGAVSNVRHTSGRAVWGAASGATSYIVRLWDGTSGRNVEGVACCRYSIPSGITQFNVRGVNSVSPGPWSGWVRVGAPPGAVSNVRHVSGRAVWGAASGATSYTVRLWDGTSGRNVEGVACCRYSIPSGITQFNVRGVNSVSPGPWSGWERAAVAPDPVRSLRIVARGWDSGDPSDREVVASWSSPADDGGSAITGYTVTISRPGRVFGPYRLSATRRSYTLTDARSDTAYTVRVVARTSVGPSQDRSASVRTPRDCPSAATGNKFKTERTGLGGRHTRVVALQDFTATHATVDDQGKLTYTEKRITKGTEGGRVDSDWNLSQAGCSWIYQDAEVSGNARISGNAVVGGGAKVSGYSRVHGRSIVWGRSSSWFGLDSDNTEVKGDNPDAFARVYGDARVYGGAKILNSAHVYGEARVYDRAQVYDNARVYDRAQVSDSARVYDNAEVSGKARVYGSASIYNNARVYGKDIYYKRDSIVLISGAAVYGGAHIYGNTGRNTEIEGDRIKISGNSEVHGGSISDDNDALHSREQVSIGGYAVVWDGADIVGGMTVYCRPDDDKKDKSKQRYSLIDRTSGPCVWDGRAEYDRAAAELYRRHHAEIVKRLLECNQFHELNSQPQTAADEFATYVLTMGPKTTNAGYGEAGAFKCARTKVLKTILEQYSNPTNLMLSIALAFAGSLQLPRFAKSLVDITVAANDIKALQEAGELLETAYEDFLRESGLGSR